MKTVVVTDGKYRSSIAVVRALGRAGYRVVVTQTRADVTCEPPVFASRYASECRWIDGSCADEEYIRRLCELLEEYEHPVLFCVGAVSLNVAARHRGRLVPLCDVLVADADTLEY